MASVTEQTVHSGNTVYIMIDRHVIGRARSLSAERDFGTQGVYEIGSIMPQEHVHLQYEGTVTLERYQMKKENLASLEIASMGEDILKKGIIDIILYDNLSNKVITVYRGCTLSSYSENIEAGAITGESARFFFLESASGM